MGDPEAENRFARARALNRRAAERGLERAREGDTIIASATLRAPVQPLPLEQEQPSKQR
jgi:hypothetical protein